MSLHPEVLWAQRSSETEEKKCIVYATVNLPDIHPETLQYDLTPTSISFKAKAGSLATGSDKEYAFSFELFGEIIPEESSKRLTSRSLDIILRKKEKKLEYWPRITKAKIKTPFLKTDFSKWVDEDEQDSKPGKDDDFDLPDMGGMPGMGGMGGMPGMGGMGGIPGMDGLGGMDFEKMMAEAGASGSGLGSGLGAADDDSDDDGPPPLEDAGHESSEETK